MTALLILSFTNDFLDGFFLVRFRLGRKAIIRFECVIKTKFLRMLKGLVPIRDIFLFHEIYILFDFTFIQ